MAADYEHNSRCKPMCIWVMLMMFWCGLTHIGTLGFHQGLYTSMLCQDRCNSQCLGKLSNMQMFTKDINDQCDIICHNMAVHLLHSNMQAKFTQEFDGANNEIESSVKTETEFDITPYARNCSKKRNYAATSNIHDVARVDDEADDDDFSHHHPWAFWSEVILHVHDKGSSHDNHKLQEWYSYLWALPTKLKRLAWYQLFGPPKEMYQQKCWHTFCLCVCAATWLDVLILLAAQEDATSRARTRSRLTNSCSLLLGPLSRIVQRCMYVTALVIVLQGSYTAVSATQLQHINVEEQRDCKQTKTTDYLRSFGVEVKAYIPKDEIVIHHRRTIGDGNCLWRAVAKFLPNKWYTLKRKVIQHMMQRAIAEDNHNRIESIKKLAKSNAWGNQDAIMGICSLLGVDICVATRSAILHFKCAADDAPMICIQLYDQHYSAIRRQDGESIFRKCSSGTCITLEDYHDLNLWSPTMIKSIKAHGDVIGHFSTQLCRKRKHCKNNTQPLKAAMPAYRPAGPNIGPPKRGPNETVADQIRRVALAKATAMLPVPPPGPPPKAGSDTNPSFVPPSPKVKPTSSPVVRPSSVPDLGPADATSSSQIPIKRRPRTPPRPRSRSRQDNRESNVQAPPARSGWRIPPPPPIPSSRRSPPTSSPAAGEDRTVTSLPAPARTGLPYISCERVIVCSRGSKFDARLPAEGRGDEYVVLSKQLHDVHENSCDRTHLAHVGFHPHIIEGLCRVPKFTDRITSLVAQALQNRKCILVFECSKGRHRSVAAAFLACLLFEPFIGFDAVQIHHLAERNWQDTCRGQCQACSAQPTAETRRIVEGMIDQVLAKLRTAYTDRLQGDPGNLCSITPPQLGNALTHVATQKCEIPHHSRTQSSSQRNFAHTEPIDASYEKLHQPNRSKWTFARTSCRQLVGVICAGVPWGLLTLHALFAITGDLNGGFLCGVRFGVRDCGVRVPLPLACDITTSSMPEYSMQRKLIFSKNQCDTPAKTRVQSIHNNLLSFCAYQRRLSASNADALPTNKHDRKPVIVEQRSSGAPDRASARTRAGETQPASDLHAAGLQNDCINGRVGTKNKPFFRTCTSLDSLSPQRSLNDYESTSDPIYRHHHRNPCNHQDDEYTLVETLRSKQHQARLDALDLGSFGIASSKNHKHHNDKHSQNVKFCSIWQSTEPTHNCAKILRSLQWFEFFQPFASNKMSTRPAYRRAGAPEVPPPGRRSGESVEDQVRRVAGLAGGSDRQRTRSPPRPSISPTIHMPTLPDGFDTPERICIVTQGTRFLAKGGVSRDDAVSEVGRDVKKVLFDMRSIRNPAQVASHRSHTGYYPRLWQDLGALPSFRQVVVEALCACNASGFIEITFQCTAGRHRSVAAAMLLERLLWRVFPTCDVAIDHLHERHWSLSTCAANCGQCWWVRNRAPSDELNALLDDLIRDYQRRAAYIDVACCQASHHEPHELNNLESTLHYSCEGGYNPGVNFESLQASHEHKQSHDYPDVCHFRRQHWTSQQLIFPHPASQACGQSQKQSIAHYSKNQIASLTSLVEIAAQTCLLSWIVLYCLTPTWSSNQFVVSMHHCPLEERHQGRSGGLPAAGYLNHPCGDSQSHLTHSLNPNATFGNPIRCNGAQIHLLDDTNMQIGLAHKQQKSHRSKDPQGQFDYSECISQRTFNAKTPSSTANYRISRQLRLAQFLADVNLIGGMEWEHVDWQLFQDISPISVHCDEDLSSFCVEPISHSSSSHAWIGAQPHSPAKTDSQQNSAYEATIADTVIDSESSKVSTTQTWTQHSAQQKPTQKRKRSDRSPEYDSSDALTPQARHGSNDYFGAQEDRLHGSRPSCDYPSPDENADRLANRGFGFSQEQDLQASRTRDTNDWASSILDFLSGLFWIPSIQYSTV